MTEVFLKRLSSSSSQAQRGISTVLLVAVVAVVALAAAGIEIPFPQRDITLRAVTPEALRALSPPGAASLQAEQPKEPS